MSIQSGYGEFGNDIPDGRKFLIRLIKPISANFGTFWNFLRKRFIRFGYNLDTTWAANRENLWTISHV